MITVSVGEIRADDAVALYEGDSAFVERLREITAYDAVELADGKYAPVSWTEPGGIRLALELVEPRFTAEWKQFLPVVLREAEKPVLEPAGNSVRVAHIY